MSDLHFFPPFTLHERAAVYFLLCYSCSKAIVWSWWMLCAFPRSAGGNLELGLQSRASAEVYPWVIHCSSVHVRTAVSGLRQTSLEHAAFNWGEGLRWHSCRCWESSLSEVDAHFVATPPIICFVPPESQAADGTWQAHLEMLFSIKSAQDAKVTPKKYNRGELEAQHP